MSKTQSIFTSADLLVQPYAFEHVLDMELHKQPGEHARFRIRGVISEKNLDQYVERADEDEQIEVRLKDEDNNIPLFQGMVTDISVRAVNGVRELSIEAISATFRMDIEKRRRSFQNTGQSYSQLFTQITSAYGGAEVVDSASGGAAIGELVVQYLETDWAFVKRVASRLHAPLLPISMQPGLKYVIGIPDLGEPVQLDEHNYRIQKNLEEYKVLSNNGVSGYQENNALSYEVISHTVLELGSAVVFRQRQLYVAQVETRLEGQLIVSRYVLRDAEGMKCRTSYAFGLSGVSLFGKVKQVAKDQVQISLDIDRGSSAAGAMWFPYSTVYSSPDGSGWYVMPENGDQVRLYFPDEVEQHAFVASSVDIASSDPVKRGDPSVKSISTKYGKQLVFTPGAVEVISNDKLLMRLTDEGGIEIISDKKIVLKAEEDIELTSGTKIYMEGMSGIQFKQGGAELNIMDDVKLSGGKVYIE